MIIIISKKKLILSLILLILIIAMLLSLLFKFPPVSVPIFSDEEVSTVIQEIFIKRNKAILDKDIETLESLYDRSVKYGIWAYEHELKKMKYLHKWSSKQGVKFSDIKTIAKIRYIKETDKGYRINLIASTEYWYFYRNEPEKTNYFRIGTYHSIDLEKVEERWVITREWYTDPFADSLHLDDIKSGEITKYIISQKKRDFTKISDRRKNSVSYADKYVGAAADEEHGLNYNKKYKNYNPLGGDCANFASQILYEGGNFKQSYSWKYDKGGSKAWVNAQSFKNYMLYSGRASKIAYGTYEQVYKASYKLLPGDFIAYEKNGKVTHISVVTGADSKGYTYVHSHNTDRYRVPWDLGWSDKGIKFWLVRVHY